MRLLGFHVNQTWGGIPELVGSKKPAVTVVLDGDNTWGWIKEVSPKTILVWRGYRPDEPGFGSPMNVKAEAAKYVEWTLNRMGGRFWDYAIGPNEPVVRDHDSMTRLAYFEAERARLLSSHGIKAAVGTFSVGNPHDMSLLDSFIPALEAAAELGGVLSLHQYGYPYSLQKEAPWLILRHRKFYDGEPSHGWAGLTDHLRDLPLIITETGGDQLIYDPVPGGWQYHMSPEKYISGLKWLDAELLKDSYVLGAAIYCCGNLSPEWMSYDVWPHTAHKIGGMLNPIYRESEWQTPGIRASGVDVSWHQKMPINWRRFNAQGIEFAYIRSSYRKTKDSRYVRHFIKSGEAGILRGAYHYMYPESPPEEQADLFASIVNESKPELPPMLDVEQSGLTEDMVKRFYDRFMEVSDRELGFYTSMYKWHKLVGRTALWAKNAPLWVADWGADRDKPRLPKPWNTWVFWQYTSKGKLDGYNSRVDMNRFNGTANKLHDDYGG